jgi:hypothetical protein
MNMMNMNAPYTSLICSVSENPTCFSSYHSERLRPGAVISALVLPLRKFAIVLGFTLLLLPFTLQAQEALTSGGTQTGSIAQGETGTWTFTANAGDSLMIRVGSPSFAPRIQVFDPANTQVAEVASGSSLNRDNFVTIAGADSGTYTVLINAPLANQSGDYRVSLGRAPATQGDLDKPLINGAEHEDELLVGGLGVWSFHAEAGDGIMVRMGARTGSALTPWLRLHGPDGALITEAQSGSSLNRDNYVTAQAETSGIYTVMVSAAHLNQSGNYVIGLGRAPAREGDQDRELVNGATHESELPVGGLGVWSFHAEAGDGIMVRMGAHTGNALSPWLRLHGPDGSLITQAQSGSSLNRDNYVTAQAETSGIYTVMVSAAHLNQSGNYVIGLGRAPAREGDQDRELVNGATHESELPVGGLEVWSFAAAEGSAIVVRMGAMDGSSLAPWLRLYGPDGALLEEAASGSSLNRDNFIIAQAPTAGIYTLLVSAATIGQSGDYSLNLAVAPGEFTVSEGDQGGPLTNGVSHPGAMIRGGLDMWSFLGTPGDSNVVTVVSTNFAPRILIYGPNGALVSEFTTGSSLTRTGSASHIVTNSGPHTVVVTGASLGQSGTYGIRQSRVPPDLNVPDDTSVNEGETLELTLSAQNPDTPSKPLQFGLISGPEGAQLALAGATNAIITWPTTEMHGPSTNIFVATVTDVVNGQAFTRTNSFEVIVHEVNQPPVLSVPANQTVNELSALNVSASATDPDWPPNELTFSLVSAPEGMIIDPETGAISWTPTEAQGPGEYDVTVRVTDFSPHAVNEQELSDTGTFRVTVNEFNHPPVLTVPPAQTVNELSTLNVSVSATDPDLPPNPLTFSLVSAPEGMAIDPASGAISWTPTEAQGPGVFEVTVRVTDQNPAAVNEQQLSDTRSFSVTVNEVNHPPSMNPVADASAQLGLLFNLTVSATDPDLPANTLTFSLEEAPSGMTIDGATGVISWTPLQEQVGNHTVVVRVTDDGTPPMNDTTSFQILVTGEGSNLAISILPGTGLAQLSTTGDAGLDYELQYSTNLVVWLRLVEFRLTESPHTFIDPASATAPMRFYRLLLIPD